MLTEETIGIQADVTVIRRNQKLELPVVPAEKIAA